MEKIQIKFKIDKKYLREWNEIQKYIIDKHGRTYGYLGNEVILNTFDNMFNSDRSTHTQEKKEQYKQNNILNGLLYFLKNLHPLKGTKEYYIKEIFIINYMIQEQHILDKRTHKKYINILINKKILNDIDYTHRNREYIVYLE